MSYRGYGLRIVERPISRCGCGLVVSVSRRGGRARRGAGSRAVPGGSARVPPGGAGGCCVRTRRARHRGVLGPARPMAAAHEQRGDREFAQAVGDVVGAKPCSCTPATTTWRSSPTTGAACMRSTTGATATPRPTGSSVSMACAPTVAAHPTTRQRHSRWRCWPPDGSTKPPRRCAKRGHGPSTSSNTPSRRSLRSRMR